MQLNSSRSGSRTSMKKAFNYPASLRRTGVPSLPQIGSGVQRFRYCDDITSVIITT